MKILNHYFSVTKVEDIRMAYNETFIGLNGSLWEPRFSLTMVRSNLRLVDQGTGTEDRYIGQMFLNFVLNEEVRPFCGGRYKSSLHMGGLVRG